MTLRTNEKYTREGRRVIADIAQPSPSCLKCTHFLVCKIAQNIFPMMESMFPNHQPFKAEDIAKICDQYDLVRIEVEEEQ